MNPTERLLSARERRITWRRANAAQALSMDEGFLNIETNLPISAPLCKNKRKNVKQHLTNENK